MSRTKHLPGYGHRELDHQASGLRAPIELKGTTFKKVTYVPSTLGKWENLMSRTQDNMREKSPDSRRVQESKNAARTIHPELNNNENNHRTRKIVNREASPENPANVLGTLLSKGLSEDEYQRQHARKKFSQKNQITMDKDVVIKRYYKTNALKFEQEASHITTLGLTTATGTYDIEYATKRASSPIAQKYLRSQIPGLPGSPSTRRSGINDTFNSDYRGDTSPDKRYVQTTTNNDVRSKFSPRPSSKRDPNFVFPSSDNERSFQINPLSRGKKSNKVQDHNIFDPPKLEEASGRKLNIYSARNYTSAIKF